MSASSIRASWLDSSSSIAFSTVARRLRPERKRRALRISPAETSEAGVSRARDAAAPTNCSCNFASWRGGTTKRTLVFQSRPKNFQSSGTHSGAFHTSNSSGAPSSSNCRETQSSAPICSSSSTISGVTRGSKRGPTRSKTVGRKKSSSTGSGSLRSTQQSDQTDGSFFSGWIMPRRAPARATTIRPARAAFVRDDREKRPHRASCRVRARGE